MTKDEKIEGWLVTIESALGHYIDLGMCPDVPYIKTDDIIIKKSIVEIRKVLSENDDAQTKIICDRYKI